MNKQWNSLPLQELTEKESPITYGVVKPGHSGDVLFIRGGDLVNGRILYDQLRTITEEVSEQYKRTLLRGGELLVSLVGQPGQVAVVPSTLAGANIARQVGIVRLDGRLDANFVSYFLQSPKGRRSLGTHTGGSVQQVINLRDLRTVCVPIPHVSEQKRIVAILDEVFAGIDDAIANTEKNLTNARELFESYLNSTFSQSDNGGFNKSNLPQWESVCIEDLCESIIDCINKTAPKVEEPSPFKMIRTTNIRYGRVNLDKVKYVTEETYHQWTRRQVPTVGDVLLTREAPMGEVGMLMTDDRVFLGQRIVSYRNDDRKLDNKFLLYAFQSSNLQEQIQSFASGSTVQHMRVPDTKALKIPLPSGPIQKQVVKQLDILLSETQRLEAIYQQKLTALNELKQSILQKAFTGELTAEGDRQSEKAKEEIAT